MVSNPKSATLSNAPQQQQQWQWNALLCSTKSNDGLTIICSSFNFYEALRARKATNELQTDFQNWKKSKERIFKFQIHPCKFYLSPVKFNKKFKKKYLGQLRWRQEFKILEVTIKGLENCKT